jgi:hypothetical protein
MKTYWGSGFIAPSILDFGTRWRWVVTFKLRPLYSQGKSLRYPLDRRLGGPQSRSGHGGEKRNSQPPPEIEPQNPDRPARSLVTIPTELSRLFFITMLVRLTMTWSVLRLWMEGTASTHRGYLRICGMNSHWDPKMGVCTAWALSIGLPTPHRESLVYFELSQRRG